MSALLWLISLVLASIGAWLIVRWSYRVEAQFLERKDLRKQARSLRTFCG